MSLFHVKEHTIPAAYIREFARATADTQDETLLLHVKQYIPKDNPNPQKGDITVIGAHANGFPKELYEPLWDDLYHAAQKNGIRIRAIWIADAAWQGRSGIINAEKLGNDPSWLDYARDITQMINTFRMPRPLMGIGHSFGGNALVNVSLLNPRMLTTLILLDPVISGFSSTPEGNAGGPANMSIYRRDVWPSRDVAAASFRKSPFYQTWDQRVLDRWVAHGLVDTPRGEVTLSTAKAQEVFTYLRPSWPAYDAQGKRIVDPEYAPDLDTKLDARFNTFPFYRPEAPNTLARLPNVRPSVLYVFGDKSNLSPADLQREKMDSTGVGVGGSGGAKAGRVKAVRSAEHGHLIPMEAPKLCAEAAAEWIKGEMERWWLAEREYEEWTRTPKADKVTISDEYKTRMGKPPRPVKKDKGKL